MGKVKKIQAKKVEVEILDGDKVQFVDVPRRSLSIIRIEMTQDKATVIPEPSSIEKNGIVKVVQRYLAGDEEIANKLLTDVMDELRKRARYIRPPDRIVIREKTKRMEELKYSLAPLEAAQIWLDKKPAKGIEPKAILKRMRAYLELLGDKDMTKGLPLSMTINSASLENWMPFADKQSIGNIPQGLVGVVGTYEGQDGRSNRAGKSAFFDAIRYAMFGECRAVKSIDELAFGGRSKMEVELAIQFGDEVVPVRRSYSGGKSDIRVRKASMKVKEANDEIEKLLGMTESDFVRTCFVRQGDLEGILTQQSAQLKADIIRWRGLDVWPSLDASVQSDESKILKAIKEEEIRDKVAREAIAKGLPEDSLIEQYQQALDSAIEKNSRISSAKERLKGLHAQGELASQVEKAKQWVEQKDVLVEQRKAIMVGLEDLEKVQKKLMADESVLAQTYKECKERGRTGFNGVCPIDEMVCPRKDEINDDMGKAKKKADSVKKKLDDASSKVNETKKDVNGMIIKLDKAKSNLSTVERAEELIAKYDGTTEDEIEKAMEEISEEVKSSLIDTKAIQYKLAELMAASKAYENAVEALHESNDKLKELQAEAKTLRYLRFMFGKNGIASMMIEDALEEIEGQVNLFLEELGTDHRLKFDSERELKRMSRTCYECGFVYDESSKEKFCADCGSARVKERSDELRPMIIEGNRKQSFEMDSGAGRALVALATRATMSKFLGASVLFLDEVSSSLDGYHQEMLIKLFHKLPSMGFNQVFVISHQKEVADAMASQIVVTRIQEEGRSTIQ